MPRNAPLLPIASLLLLSACGSQAGPTGPVAPTATAIDPPAASARPVGSATPRSSAPLALEKGWSIVARVPGAHPMHLLGGQDGVTLVSIETPDRPHRWIRVAGATAEPASIEAGMPAFTFGEPAPAEYGTPSYDSRGQSEAFLTVNRESELGATCEGFLWDGKAWSSAGTTTSTEGVCLLARVYTRGLGVALVEGNQGRTLRFFGKAAPAPLPLARVGKPAGDLVPMGVGTWATGEIVVVGVGGQAQVFAQGWGPNSKSPVTFTVPLDGNSPVDTRFPKPSTIEVFSAGVLRGKPNEEVAAKVVLGFDGKQFKQIAIGPGQTKSETVMVPSNWPQTATRDPRFKLGFVGISGDVVYVTGTVEDGDRIESVVLRDAPVDALVQLDE